MARNFAQSYKGFLGFKLIITSGANQNYDTSTNTVTLPTYASFTGTGGSEMKGITSAIDFPISATEEDDPEYGTRERITETSSTTSTMTFEAFRDLDDVLHDELLGVQGQYSGLSANTIINTDNQAIFGWYPDDTQTSGSRHVYYGIATFTATNQNAPASGKLRMSCSATLTSVQVSKTGA